MTRQGLESHTFGLDRSRYNPFTRYAVQNTFDTHKYLYLFFKFPVLSPGLSSNQHTNSVPTKSSFFHNFGIDKSFFLNPSGFYTTLAICTAILYDYTTVGDAVIDGSLFSFQVSFFFFFLFFKLNFAVITIPHLRAVTFPRDITKWDRKNLEVLSFNEEIFILKTD